MGGIIAAVALMAACGTQRDDAAVRSLPAPEIESAVSTSQPVETSGSAAAQLGDGEFEMELISDDVAVTVSSGQVIGDHWFPEAPTGTITFDMSTLTTSQREHVLVSTEFPATDFQFPFALDPPAPLMRAASSYAVELNAAPGGQAPANSWTTAFAVTPNEVRARQDVIDVRSANWLRLTVFASADPTFDMRINLFATGAVPDDDWLFLGDSITVPLDPGRLSGEVAAIAPERNMDAVNVALGGTGSDDAVAELSRSLPGFPGRFVVLAYGTNDVLGSFDLDAAIEMVIAAGKTPVVPRIPWSLAPPQGVIDINVQIDLLFDRYPELLAGPDLYATFFEKPELFNDQIHPNGGSGLDALHHAWAEMIASAPPPTSDVVPPPTSDVVPPPDVEGAINGAVRLDDPRPAVRGA